MQYYATKADAINQAITPALGDLTGGYDLDGLANATFTYEDGKGFTQAISPEEFWQIAPDHELNLFTTWIKDTNGLIWAVMTDAGAVIETGETTPAGDKDKAYNHLDESLGLAGYERGDTLNLGDNAGQFVITRTN